MRSCRILHLSALEEEHDIRRRIKELLNGTP